MAYITFDEDGLYLYHLKPYWDEEVERFMPDVDEDMETMEGLMTLDEESVKPERFGLSMNTMYEIKPIEK